MNEVLPLAVHLAGLKSLAPAIGPVRPLERGESAGEAREKMIRQYMHDMAAIQRTRTEADSNPEFETEKRPMRMFGNRNQADVLTEVLAGKDLTVESTLPLARALIGIMDGALLCVKEKDPTDGVPQMKTSSMEARSALRSLGVKGQDVTTVMDVVLQSARLFITKPLPSMSYR